MKRSRSRENVRRRSRSPRKTGKDIDENILSEISKLPEPSELWDNQFQEGFAPPPPSFVQEASTTFASNYQPSYSGIYDDFPSLSVPQTAAQPPDNSTWNQMSLPPPSAAQTYNMEEQIKKEAAIETEMRHQKAALSKQREDYIKKAGILKKELDTLKDQRNELRGDTKRSPSPDTKRFLKENTKLQLEIQNKLKTINNVVDMLNGIIGEEAQEVLASEDSDKVKRKSRSPSKEKFNYVYYDPEMHWCRVCNEFPSTAKDYLNHLHSVPHQKMAAAHMEAPWHSVTGVNEGFPNVPSAPTKRTPIRGLQFFVPSTAWYCKLCDQFIGDLHCASAHLKSITHSKNYTNFVEQNPHWETDWMSDRQKAFEKCRTAKSKTSDKPAYTAHTITFNKDGFHTKNVHSPSSTPEKKKKKEKKKKSRKRSTSSSSSESQSSISENESRKNKSKNKIQKIDLTDDKLLTDWVSSIQVDRLNPSDRKLLDNFKSKLKDNSAERRSVERRSSERSRERDREREKEKERERERYREKREIEDLQRKLRRTEENRRREERRSSTREREGRRTSTARSPSGSESKKPEVKKMPFIGKMPVYKNLSKNSKVEELKKEDQRKKEEEVEETNKKKQEIDAEIQKKVAEFKEKIAQAQLEKQHQHQHQQMHQHQHVQMQQMAPLPLAVELPPPGVALAGNTFLPPASLINTTPQTPIPQQPQPTLPKDFQEALDIIFPSEVKSAEMQNDGIFGIAPGYPLPGVMQPFPPLGLMQTQMFGFDLNAQLFQPRNQLYDTHVPLIPPQNKMRNHRKSRPSTRQDSRKLQQNDMKADKESSKEREKENGEVAKKREELDDLAMLGIDASDVGAGI